MKLPAITAALASLLVLAACEKSQSPDENPAPSAAPEPPYQSPQDTAPTSPDATAPDSTMSPDTTTPPSDQPSDTQSEPPQNPSG